jgi:hypothetical protein
MSGTAGVSYRPCAVSLFCVPQLAAMQLCQSAATSRHGFCYRSLTLVPAFVEATISSVRVFGRPDELARRTGRTNWPEELAGQIGPKNWPDELARTTGRTNWPEELAGRIGPKNWPDELARRTGPMQLPYHQVVGSVCRNVNSTGV